MTTRLISIANDFSRAPAGRYVGDGPAPGQLFRQNLLEPALREFERVVVDMDGTGGYGSSFLEEAFGGLVRQGYSMEQLRQRLQIKSSRQSYLMRAWKYIEDAAQRDSRR